jgi:predicted Zn-dependent protease
MFRDPYILTKAERTELVEELNYLVATLPNLPELRVLLGMTLCVDNNAQTALEVLRTAATMAPDNFLAQLKFGELLMRLRICDQAAEHTRLAALLAANPVQAELARRQAATIRTMGREGVERGGYSGMLSRVAGLLRRARPQDRTREITTASPG